MDHAAAVGVLQRIGHLGDQLGHRVEPLAAARLRVGEAGDAGVGLTRLGLARNRFRIPQLRHGLVEQRVGAGAAEVAEHVRQRLALDQLHGVEVAAVRLTDGVDGDDVGVVQLGGGLGLALEALDGLLGQTEGPAAGPSGRRGG